MFFKNRDMYYFIVRLCTFFVDNRQYGLPKMAALFLNLLYKAGLSGALHLPESPDKPVSPSRQSVITASRIAVKQCGTALRGYG